MDEGVEDVEDVGAVVVAHAGDRLEAAGEVLEERVGAWRAVSAAAALRVDPSKLQAVAGWLDEGLDAGKLKDAFARADNGGELFERLATARSRYHRYCEIGDYGRVPGVRQEKFVPNGLKGHRTHVSWGDSRLDLPKGEASNFTSVVAKDLPPGTKIYRVYLLLAVVVAAKYLAIRRGCPGRSRE